MALESEGIEAFVNRWESLPLFAGLSRAELNLVEDFSAPPKPAAATPPAAQ